MSTYLVTGNRYAEILYMLGQRGVSISCKQCGRSNFLIYEGNSPTFLLDDDDDLHSQSFPVVILLCQNCGFFAEHSSVVLDLVDMPIQE